MMRVVSYLEELCLRSGSRGASRELYFGSYDGAVILLAWGRRGLERDDIPFLEFIDKPASSLASASEDEERLELLELE